MKILLLKVKCAFISLTMVVLCSTTIFASQYEDNHIHGDNCLYSCVLDTIDTSILPTNGREHIEHEDSENCIYNCSHYINDYISDSCVEPWSAEERENFINEYKEISSDDEMINFIAKYSKIPAEEINLGDMRSASAEASISEERENFINEYKDISSDDEMINFIAKYSKIPAEEINLSDMRSAEASINNETLSGSSELLFCNHIYWGTCEGNHSAPNSNCYVLCH
ncbi:MAG: hypothetical protein PHZ09_12635 [Eubacteriales bacterium]|nr:hypothetical protein [Eubacteriales bacterium]